MQRPERIHLFTEAIWEWFARNKRTLPWRDMAIDDPNERAYRVLVSEVMLQQTQVSRVIIVFKNFLEQFPSLSTLAAASNSQVIMAWRGMGYNSRALRLRDAAHTVVHDFNGQFPQDMDALLSIKGLGPYTAAAVRNFAYNLPTPCIDTNIRRILHRTFVGPENPDGTWRMNDRELVHIAEEVLDVAVTDSHFSSLHSHFPRTAANWHAALMDYGSLVQTKNNPRWSECILTQRGIMITSPHNWSAPVRGTAKEKLKKEPGRLVGSVYIPNRIFRGKIVEALRDNEQGMDPEEIGRHICIDWDKKEHELWLKSLINKLVQDRLIAQRGEVYVLAD